MEAEPLRPNRQPRDVLGEGVDASGEAGTEGRFMDISGPRSARGEPTEMFASALRSASSSESSASSTSTMGWHVSKSMGASVEDDATGCASAEDEEDG